MKDAYRADIIDKHLRAQEEDDYYLVQVTGSAGKNINLDQGALLLLKQYYEGTLTPAKQPDDTPELDFKTIAQNAILALIDGCELTKEEKLDMLQLSEEEFCDVMGFALDE